MLDVVTGYTYGSHHKGRGGKPIPSHEFECIGVRRFVDGRGKLRRAHKLWKIVDCDNGLAYWRDSRRRSTEFVPVCKIDDVVFD